MWGGGAAGVVPPDNVAAAGADGEAAGGPSPGPSPLVPRGEGRAVAPLNAV
jgi:hypothetical protein